MFIKTAFLLLISLLSTALSAEPEGVDLLRACEVALDNDFHGMEGEMCRYYVTPCDCDFSKASDKPRVCLPDSVSESSLAWKVVNGLKQDPSLQEKAASAAAGVILAKDYPCP